MDITKAITKDIMSEGKKMTRYVMLSNWAPYVGTDYVDVLYSDNLADALEEAQDEAWNRWEGSDTFQEYEDDFIEDEGPDVIVEEYDPKKHDMLRTGGGSFKQDFVKIEKERG